MKAFNNAGLEIFLTKTILVRCASSYYFGTLDDVNTEVIILSDAKLIKDVGNIGTAGFNTAEDFVEDIALSIFSIEMVTEFEEE